MEMFEAGERRLAERLKEQPKSWRTDEVLCESAASPAVLLIDVADRMHRKAEKFRSEAVDRLTPSL